MAALTITCVSPPAFRRPLSLNIPNLGALEQAYDAISSIPDPSELVSKFMNQAALALAPLRKYLQVVEAIIAIKQCIEAIPKAILPPNPQPIIDCFKALIRTIAALIQDIPPIPYIQTLVDLCYFIVALIDAMATILQKLDQKISRLLNLRAYADALGDVELVDFSNCGMQDVKLTVQQMLEVFRLIAPLVNILMSVILRMIPTPAAQKAAQDYQDAAATFPSMSDTIASIDITVLGLPSLNPMMQALDVTRKALVIVHNILAPIIGEAADLSDATLPTFVNF